MMDTVTRNMESRMSTPLHQAVELMDVAEKLRDEALNFAKIKLPPVKKDQRLEALFLDRSFLCDFKHGLIEGVCQTICEYDGKAIESYCFDPDANPDCQSGEEIPIDGTINIILVVESKTAGLDAFVTSLDRGLTQALKELPIPMLASYDSVLNIIQVTRNDVEKRKGYAALISSMHVPALKIWPN
jgi:hypothetical protein